MSGAWIPDIGVRNCNLLDTTCQLGPALPTLTDAVGKAELRPRGQLPRLLRASSKPDLVPATLYPGHLLAGHRNDELPGIRTHAGGASLTSSTGHVGEGDSMPMRGSAHAVVTIYDCQDHQASGVSVSFSAPGPGARSPSTSEAGCPSTLATDTDNFGLAGAINVPAGTDDGHGAREPRTSAVVGICHLRRPPGRHLVAWSSGSDPS